MSFAAQYVLRSIKNKRYSLAIMFAFIISIAMVTSLFTWTETGSIIFSKDRLERTLQIVLTKPLTDDWYADPLFFLFYDPTFKHSIWETYNLLKNDSFVNRVEVVYSTRCLFNTENKPDSYLWYPNPEEPIIIGSAFIVNDSFLNMIKEDLGLENASLGGNGVLLSRSAATQLEKKLGIAVRVGSNISFDIATRIPKASEGEVSLRFWERASFRNLRVVGIYDWVNPDSFVSRSLHTFWHVDSVFMPLSLVNSTVREALESDAPTLKRRPGPPKLFVQIDAEEVARRDIVNLGIEIEKLKTRISYPIEDEILFSWDAEQLSQFVDAYYRSRTLLIYILPAVDLSACVVILGSEITFGGRKREAGILRARGADSRHLYVIFVAEFLILALIGTILGFMLGILLGCLIPASKGLFHYDLATFTKFMNNIQISPHSYMISFALCVTIPLMYAFGKGRSYSSADIVEVMSDRIEAKEESLRYTMGAWEIEIRGLHIRYVISTLMFASLILVKWSVDLASASLSSSLFLFIIILAHWSICAYATAVTIDKALPLLSKLFTFVLKTKGNLITLNLRRQRVYTSIVTILILGSSIMTFSLVEAETSENNLKNQIRYAIGCDLRIVTAREVDWSFARNLTEIPGISKVTPVLYYRVMFGGYPVNLIGVNPESYRDIGAWSGTSFMHPTYEQALIPLSENPNGIIISDFVADALKLDINSEIMVTKILYPGVEHYNLTVLGIMRSAPGLGYAVPTSEIMKGSIGFQEKEKFFLVSSLFPISKGVTTTTVFFAKVEEGTDVKDIIDRLANISIIKAVYSFETFDLAKEDIYRSLYMQAVSGALSLQFLIAIIIIVISLALFLRFAASRRKMEYALVRALGATRKNIALLIFMELIVVISVSMIAGSLLGMIYSALLFDLLLQIFPFRSVVRHVIAVPTVPLLAGFGIILIASLLGIYTSAKTVGKADLAGMLRNL